MAHQAASFPGGLPPNLIRGEDGHITRNPAFDRLSLSQRNFLLGSGPPVPIPEGWNVFQPNIAPEDRRTPEGQPLGSPTTRGVQTGDQPKGTPKMDNIIDWVLKQKSNFGTGAFPFNNREQMIEKGVANYGEENRQFLIDTIYRELRGADEPAYQPPPYPVYKGKSLPGEQPSGGVEKVLRAFHEFSAYKNLSEDDKFFIDEMFSLIQFGGEAEARIFANAIKQAKAIADPFFKAKLGLALAETIGQIAEVTGDFQTKKEILERARDELLEDVRLGRDFFTLEQQGDVARLSNDYQQDILQIADIAAEKGLTFATGARSRQLAESRRQDQFGDVFQSTTRRFNLRIKELELRASRGETAAQKELESLRGQRKLSLQQIGRGAEELLGTEAVSGIGGLGGFTPVGGVIGNIEEQKRRSLISDVGAFVSLQQGFLP